MSDLPLPSSPKDGTEKKPFNPKVDTILDRARAKAKADIAAMSEAEKFDEIYGMFRKDED